MSMESLVRIGIAVGILLAGNALLYLGYKKIPSQTGILHRVGLFVLSLLFGIVILSFSGIVVFDPPAPLLLLSFFAFLLTQPHPVSKSALCRALAVVSAITAILAAWNSDFVATAASLGVTGVLVHVADREASLP